MTRFSFSKQKTVLILAFLSLAGGAALGVIRIAEIRQGGNTATIFSERAPAAEFLPSDEEISDLLKPGVLRIVHTIRGEAKIPSFSIDPNTLELALDQKKILTVPIEYEIVGTGFFVNPAGNIATNAHVVSKETAKYFKIVELIELSLDKNFFFRAEKKSSSITESDKNALREKILAAEFLRIARESEFTIESDIRVLNPVSPNSSLAVLARRGFPAAIVFEENDFFTSGRDIAIIKIEGSRYPAIPIGSDANLPVARKIFAFGFSTAAESLQESPFEATLKKGIIRATKNSPQGDFALYSFDANISSGSSGGPLIDEKGTVKGILAFQASASTTDSSTDVLALPTALISDALGKARLIPETSAYYTNLIAGIQSLREKHCKEANQKFSAAREVNGAFLPALTIKKYADECAALVAAGESADSRFDAIYTFLSTVGPLFWVIIGIAIIGAVAVLAVILVLRRRIWKQEEKNESRLGSPAGFGSTHPDPVSPAERGEFAKKREPAYISFLTRREEKKDESAHTDAEFAAIAYARDERAAGFTDEQIVRALRDAGWDATAVNKIMLLSKMK